jgi:hypothetical protein
MFQLPETESELTAARANEAERARMTVAISAEVFRSMISPWNLLIDFNSKFEFIERVVRGQ